MAKLKKSWITECPACGNALAIDPETHEVISHARSTKSSGKDDSVESNPPSSEDPKPTSKEPEPESNSERDPWDW